MRFTKYIAMTSISILSLLATAQLEASPIKKLAEMQAKGNYPFELVFTVDKKRESQCSAPPVLLLTVHRDHPDHKSTLILPENSPYSSAKIISSTAHDAQSDTHYYNDEVIRKNNDGTNIVMTLFVPSLFLRITSSL